ncbi:bifunctional chorismate mutase/prephenate dehydrogenase [Pleionea sediminis]|uniref:bifunctional chorismate mutase/prephenate dehydrogenase n=1 Tax=Pleionea sediminis TaxID=2569479 RepID=UPI0011863978|nr:bifunctional chorismate mutase/prephenate dehydrogenase [Pleionea sediminis]
MTSKARLAELRHKIDECDQELLELLARRQNYVGQLVELKQSLGDALFVPDREQKMLSSIRAQAKSLDLEPSLATDIIQRIMRDSYERQARLPLASPGCQSRKICVIGGQGQIGQVFVDLFERSGHQVSVIEKDDWNKADTILNHQDLVMITVPISHLDEVFAQLGNLSSKTLLADVTSIKEQPIQNMLKVHSGPVIGLHPMFGSGVYQLARQLILYSKGRDFEAAQWLLKQFKLWGCQLTEVDAQKHDKVMATVQAQRLLMSFVSGWQLMEGEVSLDDLWQLSSPVFRLELSLVGRLFAQCPDVFVDIMLQAQQHASNTEQLSHRIDKILGWLNNARRDELLHQFNKISDYFSHANHDFLHQSDTLLEAFRERVEPD